MCTSDGDVGGKTVPAFLVVFLVVLLGTSRADCVVGGVGLGEFFMAL